MNRLRSLFGVLKSRRDFEQGMTEELRFHIEQYMDDLVRYGVPPQEAARRARIEFGSLNSVRLVVDAGGRVGSVADRRGEPVEPAFNPGQ